MNSERQIVFRLKEGKSKLNEAKVPTEKELHSICKKYGYDFAYMSKTGHRVSFYDLRGRDQYSPDIFYTASFGSAPTFTINQASYGDKTVRDFERIHKCNQDAINLCKELMRYDIQSMNVAEDK